ncbi:MAG: hypothetical protein ACE366_24055 [Bradymonadia bacterium]
MLSAIEQVPMHDTLDPLEPHSIEQGQTIRWHLGPLTLELTHRPDDWRVVWWSDKDPTAKVWSCAVHDTSTLEPPPDGFHASRFAATDIDEVQITPMLADRPVVVRPDEPLWVPPEGKAIIYVTTPMWCGVHIGGVQIMELPTYRPSDTWFGPNFREGVLCYAGRTAARMRVEALLGLRYRVATEVIIHNRHSDGLTVERLSLPTDHLAMYRDAGGLWTESVQAEWAGGTEPLPVRIIPGAPPTITDGVKIGERRLPVTDPLIFRMFSRLRRSGG